MEITHLTIPSIKPQFFFLSFSLVFGLIILLITPPFQVPDEANHFYRAYQISEGTFISVKQDNRVGGYIPASLKEITNPFLNLPWNKYAKTNRKTIFDQFKIPLKEEEKIFVDFPNTGIYTPVSYLPQSFTIFFLRTFHLSPLSIFYGARIATLLCWILCVFFVIKIMPFYKWFFSFVALLPMSLFINMSLSADVVTNLIAFLMIAYLLKMTYSVEKILVRHLVIISFLIILLVSAKLVYSPLIVLYLLIPKEKFQTKKHYYFHLLVLFFISFCTVLFWSIIMNGLYLPYHQYNPQFRDGAPLISCADMQEQMQYILNHGFYLAHVFVDSMYQSFDMYFQGYIGTFGWLDTKLPFGLICFSYLLLFAVAITDGNKEFRLPTKNKIILFLSAISMIGLILLSQHLTWDCVGSSIIVTLQGRYFIPVFPLLFLLFYNSKYKYTKAVVPLVIVFTFFILSFTVKILYKRYYQLPEFKELTIINCDAEKIIETNFFETSLSSFVLENGNTQTNEKAKSGNFSAKLTREKPFGFTGHFYNCEPGDIIKIEVWKFGKTGEIVISESRPLETKSIETDSTGWERLQRIYTIPPNNEEVGIFLYNNKMDSVYFDDVKITYKRKKEYKNQ